MVYGDKENPNRANLFGLLLTPVMVARGIPGALILSIAILTLIGFFVPGTGDKMVLPRGGRNTAKAVPGARLELIEGMAELGILGIVVPEEYGGAGLDFVAEALACEEIERGEAAFRTLISVHVGLNSLSLLKYGTEEQKQRWLAPQAKGDSTLDLDLQFTKVNQDQQISAPANPKPFSDLLRVTGALNGGGLGIAPLASAFGVVVAGGASLGNEGFASGIVVRGRSSFEFTDSGGLTSGAVISSGATEEVGAGGTVVATIISSGGTQRVDSYGTASATQVLAGGAVLLQAGVSEIGSTVSSGATFELVDQYIAANTTYSIGLEGGDSAISGVTVRAGAVVDLEGGVVTGGGELLVGSGGVADGEQVSSGGVVSVLSGGRVVFGAGLGGSASEFGKFGEPTEARVRAAMLDEGLDVLRALWAGDEVNHRGAHYTVEQVTLVPTPVQERVPIWVGGNRPASLRRASRWDGWIATPPGCCSSPTTSGWWPTSPRRRRTCPSATWPRCRASSRRRGWSPCGAGWSSRMGPRARPGRGSATRGPPPCTARPGGPRPRAAGTRAATGPARWRWRPGRPRTGSAGGRRGP